LILGGTWSSYRRDYQEWFVKRCFDAMNNIPHLPAGEEKIGEGELANAHSINETAAHRNVGLVIETRPDEINPDEIRWLRHLGVTKVQMGAQSLDDRILEMNKRGHDVESTRQATALLRAAGFKIVLHWMPNLHGATPESDREDFARIVDRFLPRRNQDLPEPIAGKCRTVRILAARRIPAVHHRGTVELIADIKPTIPRYCRVNRVIRDIPSNERGGGQPPHQPAAGCSREMKRRGTRCQCVRCREVRGKSVNDLVYQAGTAEEHFISFVTPEDKLAGFVRLSLPGKDSPRKRAWLI
jgi:elongator complex protein 3